MLNDIFDINKFNIYSDEENYYFFRALNMADNVDIENGITLDSNGKIDKIRTNRERYDGIPKYSAEDILSLEQMTDHIKMHQLKETNCISLTSNANTALSYGRGYYKDKYVMIKVPKIELGKSTYEAGLYMLEQIDNILNNYVENDDILKRHFEEIDSCSNSDELKEIKQNLIKNNIIKIESNNDDNDGNEDSDLFEQGYSHKITNSKNYISLNEEQNFEKNKMVLKIDLFTKQILPKISNRLLIQTIGNAFSSLEMIHYGEINKDEIIELPKEITDVFGLIQQMPTNLEYIDEIKDILISKVQSTKFTGGFTYKDFNIEDSSLSIENLYKITEGKVSYGDAVDLYKKAFYLAKSKLRTKRSVQVLNKLLDNNPKYYSTLNYILKNGYGIEPEITTRLSKNLVSVSESVSIDISNNKSELVDYINSLDENYLTYILDSPNNAFEMLFPRFLEKQDNVERKEWIADAMIDLLDLSRFNIKFNLRETQREAIKNALIENNVEEIYFNLKRQNVKEKDIANVLFTNIIKNKNTIDLNDTFSLEELEYFIGYNRVKGTGLILRKYQNPIVENINKNFESRNFTSVILPTGAGKSYIALAEMYKFEKTLNELNKDNHVKILYLAPNDEILNQLKDIIRETYKPEIHLTDKDIDQDIKRIFPNLILSTYQNLKDRTDNDNNIKEIFETKYDLIIFDELHRTGAREWQNHIDELIDNQDQNVKVLGITATPERDMDSRDMTEYWARKFRYTDEEILEQKHLSYNMNIIEAIKRGIVACPKVVNCIYNLKNDIDDLKFSIDEIKDDQIRNEKLLKYEKIRRTVDSAIGIEQVLNENIKQDGKYIVFLPITRKCEDEDGNAIYEDGNGNEVKQSVAHQIISDYQILFHQYLFSDEYLKNNPNIKIIYNKIVANLRLTDDEINYLKIEKNSIMLLSKVEMKYKQNDLISQNDLIANEIISFMNWEKISKEDLASELKEKMKDKVEDYSMLGSYGVKANKKILDKFNKPTTGKTKLMFVMNKLNEGIHAKGISGIIWMRPMDQNSRILFLQQLGRCIKSLDENQEIDENDIPMVIDLVNNSLKVKLDKNHSLEQDDLENIIMVKNWINSKNRMPNGKSNNKEETFIARTIIELQDRYHKYLQNPSLLKEYMKYEKTIVKIGCDIDIWNLKIEFDKSIRKKQEQEKEDDLIGLLGLESITRDFIELKNDIKINYTNFNLHIIEAIEWFKKNKRMPVGSVDKFNDGIGIYSFLCNARDVGKINKQENLNLYNIIIKYDPVFFDSSINKKDYFREVHINEAIEWFKKNKRMPIEGLDKFSDGIDIERFIGTLFNINFIKENCMELFDLIKIYKPTYGTNQSITDYIFEQHALEAIEWFRKNKRKPKGSDARKGNKGDCFLDGKNIYDFLRNKQEKIKGYIELVELINKYYPNYFNENSVADFKFEQHLEELIKWMKDNGRKLVYPRNANPDEVEKFSDGNSMYEFLFRKNTIEKIISDYKDELRIIKKIYPSYGITKLNIIDIKMKEVYEKFCEYPENLNITSDEKFEVDGSTYKSFLTNQRDKILKEAKKNNKYAIWIVDEILNKKGHTISPCEYVDIIELYCETFKEWPKEKSFENEIDGISGSQLYNWLSGTSKYISGNFKYEKDYPGLKERLDFLKKTYQLKLGPVQYVDFIELYCETFKEWPKKNVIEKQIEGLSSKQLYEWLSRTSKYISGNFKYEKDYPGLKERLDVLKFHYSKSKEYKKSKQEFEEKSKFEEQKQKVELKENTNGRKLS